MKSVLRINFQYKEIMIMKKLITIFLAIVLVMSLSACNNADNKDIGNTVNSTTGNSETNVTEDTNESTSATNNTSDATVNDNTTDPTQNTDEGTAPTDRDDKDETTPTTGNENTEGTEPNQNDTTQPTVGTTVTEPAHTHEYKSTVTNSTCTDDGYTTHTCSCGDSYVDSKISAIGHNFGEWKTTKEATTTSTGTEERKCKNCDAKETKTIGKIVENHTHSYTAKTTKAATCSAEGVKTYTCSCGDSYTESLAKTAHSYQSVVTKPDCTNGGYTTYACSCGDTYSDNKTSALGHAYSAVKTYIPTCTEQGYTLHKCSRCDASYKDNIKAAYGHDYDVTSNTATCTSAGTKTETCYFCGDVKQTASPAKGHGATREERKEATTESTGYVRQICTVCGQTVSEQKLDKLTCSHNWERMMCLDVANYANYNPDLIAYTEWPDWSVNFCKKCYLDDDTTMQYALTYEEAAQIMLGYVNQLRYEVYGTHDYDLQLGTGEWVNMVQFIAEELSKNYQHSGLPSENIAYGCTNVKDFFECWKNSSGHYANMINKNYKYIVFASYSPYETGPCGRYGVQLFSSIDDPYHWAE